MNKQSFKNVILFSAVAVITSLIFCNSFSDFAHSHASSNAITEIVLPHEYATNETVLLVVRKLAHIVEFAALGCVVFLLVHSLVKKYSLLGYALFYVLLVGVIDEHIQSFSDRANSTGDVILDFCGALIGFLVVWLASKVYRKFKEHRNNKR